MDPAPASTNTALRTRLERWCGRYDGCLAFHLLLIPIAASGPALNAGDPSTWSRFYEYVSLAQYGGGWLVQFYPRNAALWSVQVMDALRAFSSNFLSAGFVDAEDNGRVV